nr:EOG090X05V9 [Eulimnadia texana]
MRDVPKYLASKIASSSDKALAEEWAKLENLHTKKLWHQLTLEILEFVKHPALQTGKELVQLYENFIADFENKINQLTLVEICSFIIRQIETSDERLNFLTQLAEKVQASKEALALCKILAGNIKLHELNDQAGAKLLMEEIDKVLDETDGITPVHGRYYLLCSDFYRIQAKHADYYRAALRYLGCTDLDTLSADEKQKQAFQLGLAALLGQGIYNIGELLAHPVLEQLQQTEHKWLIDLLYALNCGDINGFENLKKFWSSQPDLVANELKIRQKITLLALMEMTFKRPATDRNLSFPDIALATGVPENQVELLVMKALAQGLLRGTIDQVNRTAHFTWVQPRVLDKAQLASMIQRLDLWCKDIESMESLVETKAQDILTL